ncbi:hypothetical protein CN689_13985 [Peribacillus butanolivorans]|uniref:Uncharacterized protein n=1 Tax=Peribacillus butanolivorans TaxID=421767 RepID=A0AAX0S3D7_9BACI|nr:hypothetical protein DTO10_01315 [Peribacillus butanolivorans]PEJ32235.1 hypothetical protein CN689_13985 [Peribacillus butanolivorans]
MIQKRNNNFTDKTKTIRDLPGLFFIFVKIKDFKIVLEDKNFEFSLLKKKVHIKMTKINFKSINL